MRITKKIIKDIITQHCFHNNSQKLIFGVIDK